MNKKEADKKTDEILESIGGISSAQLVDDGFYERIMSRQHLYKPAYRLQYSFKYVAAALVAAVITLNILLIVQHKKRVQGRGVVMQEKFARYYFDDSAIKY